MLSYEWPRMTHKTQSSESGIGIEPGPIATISGSILSFNEDEEREDDCNYDLNIIDVSEDEEDEIKKKSLHDQWRVFFNQFDREGYGEIPWKDFLEVMESTVFVQRVNVGKREILLDKANSATTPAITFQEFVNVMTGKRTRSFKCAVHQRDLEVSSENNFCLPPVSDTPLISRINSIVADEFLADERDRRYFLSNYKCNPPPILIMLITFVELVSFTYYTFKVGDFHLSGPVPTDSIFIYRQDKRQEVWRFLFYTIVHTGWLQLCFNLIIQLLIGLPLEMVHGTGRIAVIYISGVMFGSLGTCLFDVNALYLVGASGGVYALLAAHISNIILNARHLQCVLLRVIAIMAIASSDFGYAIYVRVETASTSFIVHLVGALTGLTVGLTVLKNFEQKLHEQAVWWVVLVFTGAWFVFILIFNVFR